MRRTGALHRVDHGANNDQRTCGQRSLQNDHPAMVHAASLIAVTALFPAVDRFFSAGDDTPDIVDNGEEDRGGMVS
jgi:hypothetical protein